MGSDVSWGGELELLIPIAEETLQTHSLRHSQYGLRDVLSPFPGHLLLCHSPNIAHICPLCHAAETM
jgi:hypothetical protein